MSMLQAARAGQAAERRRILRIIDEMAWGASCSPQPAGRVVEERLETLRRSVDRTSGPPSMTAEPLTPEEEAREAWDRYFNGYFFTKPTAIRSSEPSWVHRERVLFEQGWAAARAAHTPSAGEGLDAAWAEAESALRGRGWDWSVTIEHHDSGDGYSEPHYDGFRAKVTLGTAFPQWAQTVSGSIEPDPAAASSALAAALHGSEAKP